jgi:hypothetical protein
MTIQIHPGIAPSTPSYAPSVNAAPTRASSVGTAYARYLRHRADAFDAELATSDEAMEALIRTETEALLAVAAAPARSMEEFALKLELLQSEIEAHDAGQTASVLAACLVADLRNI